MPVPSTTAAPGRGARGGPQGADARSKARILARLERTAAHLAAVVHMVEEDRHCIDVIKQVQAVQGAISKTILVLPKRRVGHCVSVAMHATDPRVRERGIDELLDVFEHGCRG